MGQLHMSRGIVIATHSEGVNQCLVMIECHEHSSKTLMQGYILYIKQ